MAVVVWCWCGVGMVLAWCWRGAGVVLAWCWCGAGVVLVWCWRGVGVVLRSDDCGQDERHQLRQTLDSKYYEVLAVLAVLVLPAFIDPAVTTATSTPCATATNARLAAVAREASLCAGREPSGPEPGADV